MGNAKFSARKIDSGIPGTPLGKPIAALFASTSVRSFLAPDISGHLLVGGSVPFSTQSRSATRRRFVSAVAGTGFARSVPVPQLLPGQLAPVGLVAWLKPPPPPPCVELGR